MKRTVHLLILLLSGCSSPEPPHLIRIMPEAPPSKPWSDGQVGTYWVGRTTAGADGTVIHEAHPIYRLEGAGQPQLATPTAFWYPPNAAAIATNAAFEQYEALRAETARARDLTRKLLQATDDLGQRAGALRTVVETNRQWQEQVSHVLQGTAALSNRVQILEHRLTNSAPKPTP